MSQPGDIVLIVDDNEVGRYAKRRTLQRAGYEVHEAGSGSEALAVFERVRPRLVVLDVQLPDTSGWEICTKLKQHPAAPLVLQVSATYVREEDTVRALEGGADGCLTEPIEPTVLVATVRALLRTRRAEDELRAALAREQDARNQAEGANRAKDEFLAMLGHELRNPLAAVCNAIAVARVGHQERDRALEIAARQSDQLRKLIDDLLDVARITHGRIDLRVQRIALNDVLTRALETAAIYAHDQKQRLLVEIPDERIEVDGDAGRLEQVLVNLLENATKYTEAGGEIRLSLSRRDGMAIVSVRDSGVGIAADMLPRVFDLFSQAEPPLHRPQSGLGLGLALVQRIVHLHGGEVEGRSEGLGHGSEFTIRLPEAAALPAETGPLDVVLIERFPDAREDLTLLLERFGHKVRAFSDGPAAVASARSAPPDLMIVDLDLPGMDGYDVARLARAHPSLERVALVALSAYGSTHGGPAPLRAGFSHHLPKPVEAADLRALLATLAKPR